MERTAIIRVFYRPGDDDYIIRDSVNEFEDDWAMGKEDIDRIVRERELLLRQRGYTRIEKQLPKHYPPGDFELGI